LTLTGAHRAAGSRGAGHLLVLPGAPWDPGAAGCNQLIRDGATLVRSLSDILQELGATASVGPTVGPATGPALAAGPGAGLAPAPDAGLAATPGAGLAAGPGVGPRAWAGLDPAARAVLTALIDGQLLTPGRLAGATDLPPATLDAALLDLELAGLIRRSAAGIQAINLPSPRAPAASPPDLGGHARPGAVGARPRASGTAGSRAARRGA
jgi:DNA processing protein